MTAVLSPRVWLLGVPILGALMIYHFSVILLIIAVVAVPHVITAFRFNPQDPANAAATLADDARSRVRWRLRPGCIGWRSSPFGVVYDDCSTARDGASYIAARGSAGCACELNQMFIPFVLAVTLFRRSLPHDRRDRGLRSPPGTARCWAPCAAIGAYFAAQLQRWPPLAAGRRRTRNFFLNLFNAMIPLRRAARWRPRDGIVLIAAQVWLLRRCAILGALMIYHFSVILTDHRRRGSCRT